MPSLYLSAGGCVVTVCLRSSVTVILQLKMSPSLICLCFALLVQTYMVPCDAVDVDQTSCTNGGKECSGITHSVCDIAALKCKCAAYATMATTACTPTACTTDNTPCIAKDANSVCVGAAACGCKTDFSLGIDGKCYQSVTSTVCTASGTECSSITNALCDTTTLKCKCAGISAMIANTCTGKACTASTTCTALDSNSECSGAAATDKCQCKSGYKIGSAGKCVLSCTASTTCIAVDANSECSGTTAGSVCQCKTGYLMGSDGKCASGAATVLVSITMLFACFIARLL